MRAYIDLKTNIPDLHIDYIELKDKAGNVYNLFREWTEYTNVDGKYEAIWKGLEINDDDTNGRLHMIPDDSEVFSVGLYWESDIDEPVVKDMELVLEDGGTGYLPIDPPLTKSFNCENVMEVFERT